MFGFICSIHWCIYTYQMQYIRWGKWRSCFILNPNTPKMSLAWHFTPTCSAGGDCIHACTQYVRETCLGLQPYKVTSPQSLQFQHLSPGTTCLFHSISPLPGLLSKRARSSPCLRGRRVKRHMKKGAMTTICLEPPPSQEWDNMFRNNNSKTLSACQRTS